MRNREIEKCGGMARSRTLSSTSRGVVRSSVQSAARRTSSRVNQPASAISTGALGAFVALVLGAVAGWLGGRSGVVHPVFADGLVPHRRRLP